ncbi:peptidoglycan editing factor PgeF [Shouchella shacheensis]|uniref:peptidoglycan editing factor PgeF n=1 Tax=Shouchella shacheensis TaxID=1649580 RepID=UPI00073FB018|nr:peptidoglycan editing factor PgeF [Shouchella shacheensis]
MGSNEYRHATDRFLQATTFSSLSPHLLAGFTTRNGGVSKGPFHSLNLGFHVGDDPCSVVENRTRVAEDIGLPLDRWIGSEQVHGARIVYVTREDAGRGATSLDTALLGTDGLYTSDEGLVLTSLYADCTPLSFYAPTHGFIGLAHAGWKGTVAKIGPTMVHTWKKEHDIPTENVFVLVGPCISADHYEVDERVMQEVRKVCPEADTMPFEETRPGHYSLNLSLLNKQLLIRAGVKEDHIYMSSYCTFKEHQFFSHRGDQGRSGRMMSVIALRSKGELDT